MTTPLSPNKTYPLRALSKEHQREIIGNLGRQVAEKTFWKLIPDFPASHASMMAWDTSVVIFDAHVASVKHEIERDGKILRPILIDDLDEERPWMEGRHRSIAAEELGLETIPALIRVE